MIKAVIFDMDGTLFDTESIYGQAARTAGRQLGLSEQLSEEILAHCIGRNAADQRRYFESELAGVASYDDYIAARSRNYDAIIEQKGGIPLKPGLFQTMDYLKQHGYRIALATATRTVRTEENLSKTGLRHYFDVLITGDMVTHGKPAPDTFLLAAEHLGVAPEECMGVEDSFNGVRAIHAAGMRTVMIPDTMKPTPEIAALVDDMCRTLDEIILLLEQQGKK